MCYMVLRFSQIDHGEFISMPLIDQLLEALSEHEASDIHLIIGQPAKIRVHGTLEPLTDNIISEKYMEEMLHEICSLENWEYFLKNKDLDFAYEIPGKARFRTNYLYNYYGMAAVFHKIPLKIPTMQELLLPDVLKKICDSNSTGGLYCITGPVGSGKSTTLAAMIEYINLKHCKHIITLENPIEFVYKDKKSIIVQREIGIHSNSFTNALNNAMRSDPDIILLGGMHNLETIRLALTCAAMGIQVFTTLNTNNAFKTINHIIDSFPVGEQPQIRTILSETLRGIVSQVLCKKNAGGRIAVNEILLWTEELPNIIRENQISKIHTIIEDSKSMGMQSMDDTLKKYLLDNIISPEEAYMQAANKKKFIEFLR
jgi:twitching motility protein PilT